MQARRGVSTVVTGLIAVVAILGTTIYFMSGNTFTSPIQMGQQQETKPSSGGLQPELPSTSVTKQETTTTQTSTTTSLPPAESHSQEVTLTMEEECAQLGISEEDCNETNILAKKRLGAGQPTVSGQDSIKVTNVHSWVRSDNRAATAFVIQNTGSNAINVNYINLRGISVPTSDWWSVKSTSQNELQTPLPVDYDASNGVTGIAGMFVAGSISLSQDESAIIYLSEAGQIDAIDAGNTYALQVWAGQATAIQQVSVITSN